MRLFDAAASIVRAAYGRLGEHLLVERSGVWTRLDVVEGTTYVRPVILHFELVDDCRLDVQIGALRLFCGTGRPRPHYRFARRLAALEAVDARSDGASLSETARLVLGPGDWPGDGDHRKSLVRRLITTGERMIRAGPRAIFENQARR